MKHITRLLGFLSLMILISCAEDKQTDKEYGNIPEHLKDLLSDIGTEKQSFSMLPSQANTIVGKEGTIVLIPKESIVDQNNIPVQDSVTIELKEHFKLDDFILSNLQTVSNDNLLVSKGMIFLTAKDRFGGELKIAENKKIRIEIPIPGQSENAQIFIGQRNELGYINWTLPPEQTKTLIPFPVRFISKNRTWTECSDYYGITKDTINDKYYNYYGDIEEFENTLLATKAFRDRFEITCWDSVLHIYINNLDKNLWEIDELVVDYFIKDSAYRVDYQINHPPVGIYGGDPTPDQLKAHKWLINHAKEGGHWPIVLYKKFAAQKLTKVDTTQLIDTAKIDEINSALISYDAINFGWVNVDYFYNDPKSEPIRLIAKTNENAPLINLIIKNKNVILSGIDKGNNEYWFTKTEDGYNRLPVGDTAIILGIGLVDNEIIFDKSEVVIGEQEIINLTLEKTDRQGLTNELNKLR